MSVYQYAVYEWIPKSLIYLTCFVINLVILRKNIQNVKKLTNIVFASNAIKCYPIGCMVSGVLVGLFGCIRHFLFFASFPFNVIIQLLHSNHYLWDISIISIILLFFPNKGIFR